MSLSMDERARVELCRMVAEHADRLDDSGCVRGLLADYCAMFSRERNVLLCAAEDGVHRHLRANRRPLDDEVRRLSRRLHERYALDRDAAQWAIESWCVALGLRPPGSTVSETRGSRAFDGLVRRALGLGLGAVVCGWLVLEQSSAVEPRTPIALDEPPERPWETTGLVDDGRPTEDSGGPEDELPPRPMTTTIDHETKKGRKHTANRPLGRPSVRVSRLTVAGRSNGLRIREVVILHLSSLRKCYASAVEGETMLSGQITASAEVDAEGRITSVSIREPSLEDVELRRCTRHVMRSWGFPRDLVEVGLSFDVTFSFWLA